MPRLFSDYKKSVINVYQQKKERAELPNELQSPSPAQLRDYCLQLLVTRSDKADFPVIKAVFDPLKRYDHIESAIRKCEIDKLRPLINFLKGETRDTSDNMIKLLAWLIDFKPRPYEVWRDAGVEVPAHIKENSVEKVEKLEKVGPRLTSTPLALLILGVIITISIWWAGLSSTSTQCMYWSDDRYLAIACQEEVDDGIVKIALDKKLLNNFRRITQPDTLTHYSIGRVSYTKMTQDSLVYFTGPGSGSGLGLGPGHHPVHRHKTLRPLTKYILDKYIQNH